MKKPMQFTIVSEVPRDSSGAFWATIVEKSGESAVTVIPQKNKKVRKVVEEAWMIKKGEVRQHMQESDKAMVAIFLAP